MADIYVFDREEKFQAILSNEDKDACPFWDAPVNEVLNGEFTMQFRVPYSHEDAKKIEEKGYVAIQNRQGFYQLFIVNEIEDVHGSEVIRQVFCENAMVELMDEIIEFEWLDRRRVDLALETILSYAPRWQVGKIENTTQHNYTMRYVNVLEALSVLSERWNVELQFRVDISGNRIVGRYVDAIRRRGKYTGKRFEYSKDMTEVQRTINTANLKTALFGIGARIEDETNEEVTIQSGPEEGLNVDFSSVEWSVANGDPVDKPLGQTYVALDEAREIFGKVMPNGQKRHLFGVYTNTQQQDPEGLLRETYETLVANSMPVVEYSCSVIDLSRLIGVEHEHIAIGDEVPLIDDDLDIELIARVIELEYDYAEPTNSSVTLGNFMPRFTGNLREEIERLRDEVDTVHRRQRELQLPDDILREGDIIYTDWLEGAIDAAQNRLRAGNGTVTITEQDGIMIVDNPDNPQKALRLLAGSLALANSRDPNTNQFNWRTFSTGEGFLSDLVETGFLRFDRSRGGTLMLGGEIIGYDEDNNPVYQNGRLEVYDEENNLRVELDGNTGGFQSLYVGTITGENVVTQTTADVVYYVDHVNGSDDNDGLTEETAFGSIAYAVSQVPLVNNYEYEIIVANGGSGRIISEDININGLIGSGSLHLQLGLRNQYQGVVRVQGCTCQIFIQPQRGTATLPQSDKTIIINPNAVDYNMLALRTAHVQMRNIIMIGNEDFPTRYNFYASTSYLRLNDCEGYGSNTAAIISAYGSRVDNYNTVGHSVRGLYAYSSSMIGGNGTAPTGSSHNATTTQGGYIGISFNHTSGRNPLSNYVPPQTTIWTPNDVASYNSNTFWHDDRLFHGKRPSDPPIWHGVIFFNSRNFSALRNDDNSIRPITRVRLRLRRTNHTGENTSRKPLIYTSEQTSKSGQPSRYGSGFRSNVGFNWGEQKWITLPNRFGEEFQSGRAKSIVLYDGSNTSNYARFETNDIQLEIRHG